MSDKIINYFYEISQIPRCSGHEQRVRKYLINWAKIREYNYKVDKIGNLVVYIPATQDKIDSESIILQSHMDMVCVKTDKSNHNFKKDGIKIIQKDGYLQAKDTSLGADNGVGMALMLAAVDYKSHPSMELVFTMNEEGGLEGVLNFDASLVTSKRIMNLDSEDDAYITISSAGRCDIGVKGTFELIKANYAQYEIKISGMLGGHSGTEIVKNRGNAIYLLFEFLYEYEGNTELVLINGGEASNIIPSASTMVIGIENIYEFNDKLNKFLSKYIINHDCSDISFKINKTRINRKICKDYKNIINKILSIPDGVISMHEGIKSLPRTSNNLGMIDLSNGKLFLNYLIRSCENNDILEIKDKIHHSFNDNNFKIKIGSMFKGWDSDLDSDLIKLASSAIKYVSGKRPLLEAVHAGLECGELVGKLGDGAQAISIGPMIKDAHSIFESVSIRSVQRFDKILQYILGKIG